MDRMNRKLRSQDTWQEVRRAWEQGETAASVALRYEVGLSNLWRRRASEGWRRTSAPDPVPEPIEGWDRWVERKQETFELALDSTRNLALTLVEGLRAEGPPETVALWHVGFVLAWRAEHLGPEVASADKAWLIAKCPWAAELWTATGELQDVAAMDRVTARANRDAWREDMGLPEGVASHLP